MSIVSLLRKLEESEHAQVSPEHTAFDLSRIESAIRTGATRSLVDFRKQRIMELVA